MWYSIFYTRMPGSRINLDYKQSYYFVNQFCYHNEEKLYFGRIQNIQIRYCDSNLNRKWVHLYSRLKMLFSEGYNQLFQFV